MFAACVFVSLLLATSVADMINVKAFFAGKEAKQGEIRLRMATTLPDVSELTICHWVSASGAIKPKGNFILSYAHGKAADELQTGIVPEATGGGLTLRMSVRDQPVSIPTKLFKAGQWHHLCFTWSAGNGRVSGYLDGILAGTVDNVQLGQTVRSGGVLIIGQDQDVFNGKFDLEEAWEGSVTDLQLWDEVLPAEDILSLAKCKMHLEGNLVAWMKTPFQALNGVILTESQVCKTAASSPTRHC